MLGAVPAASISGNFNLQPSLPSAPAQRATEPFDDSLLNQFCEIYGITHDDRIRLRTLSFVPGMTQITSVSQDVWEGKLGFSKEGWMRILHASQQFSGMRSG